jgi:hypothetical protein
MDGCIARTDAPTELYALAVQPSSSRQPENSRGGIQQQASSSGRGPLAGLPIRRSAIRSDTVGPSPQPFDELSLSDEQVKAKTSELLREGYFTVAVSETTASFLKSNNDDNANWDTQHFGSTISFIGSPFEQNATSTAEKVVTTLSSLDRHVALVPQEFEIRRPFDKGAYRWHRDKQPKKLVCLATIEGGGTEFVSPDIADEKFVSEGGIVMRPRDGDASISDDIQRAKSGQFYFFAGRGVDQATVPKLVHRAPGEVGRAIFMARWK